MKPTGKNRLALHLLHFYGRELASADDVVDDAKQLDAEGLKHFKTVARLSFSGTLLERVLPVIERL